MYRILLVDRDGPNLNAMQAVLAERDFGAIEVYADVEEALQRAGQCSFDVVVAGHGAGDDNDMGFARRLRRLQPQTAMIIVAAHCDAAVLFEAINSVGVLRVFAKPWGCDDLCEAVAKALIQREYSTRLERMQDLVMDQQRLIERQADILLRLEVAHPGITSAA